MGDVLTRLSKSRRIQIVQSFQGGTSIKTLAIVHAVTIHAIEAIIRQAMIEHAATDD